MHEVVDAFTGQRLDNYLIRELKGVPRQLIYRLLRKGRIKLNGKKAAPSTKLASGDVLAIPPLRTGERAKEPLRNPILPESIHEDKDFIIFDKPAGYAVHGGSGLSHGVIEAARQEIGDERLELAHRLDKDTSGLLVVAKSRRGLRSFHAQLREGSVRKTYHAIVLGAWSKDNSVIDLPLRKIPASKGSRRSVVSDDGARSVTRCECVVQLDKGAVLTVELVTGKTHQARVHLAEVGNPILGDTRYGDRDANASARRGGCRGLMLHAHSLEFRLPGEGGYISLTSEIPDRFATAQQWLAGKRPESLGDN